MADAVGVTVVLLTCSYRGKEFVRVGYYVNNEYADPEMRENPPATPIYEKVLKILVRLRKNLFMSLSFQLIRNILATQPRVTRFKIEWDEEPQMEPAPQLELVHSRDLPINNPNETETLNLETLVLQQ